jgi:RHH-type proline utilization regulon transcriptional repressor/proline dehydrogenase/delta 1-pyrroline-5-carboxylate dehydrogenase
MTWLEAAAGSDAYWWHHEYSMPRDESGLRVESNVFRYRRRPGMVIRAGDGASERDVVRTALAALRAAGDVSVSTTGPLAAVEAAGFDMVVESDADLVGRMRPWSRLRYVGTPSSQLRVAAWGAEIDLLDAPVTADGRRELLWYLREQAVSRTLHRFGNLVAT